MNNPSRFLLLSITFIGVSGQAPPVSLKSESAFCERLGQQIGIEVKQLEDGSVGWTANALNFGQRVLFGGVATTSVNVEPVEPATVEDYKRLADMCVPEPKGAVCRLVGPVQFEFGWKGDRTITTVLPNETAVVRVQGTRATCQSDSADPVS